MKMISVDRSRLDSQLSDVRRSMESKIGDSQRETEEKIRLAAIYVAQECAERTFPSASAIGLAVAAMRFDISRVFITAGSAYEKVKQTAGVGAAGAFYAAYKRGDHSRALTILRTAGILPGISIGQLDPALHERARNPKDGRVMLAQPLQIVGKDELAAYVKEQIAKIGKTASGWNACAAKLGGSESATRWKSTAIHGDDGGEISIENTGAKIVFNITNLRPLARKHLSPGQLATIAKRGRDYLMQLLSVR
ncbi:MAG: hypothetical protein V4819_19200 [Verrucomicrobiota bacterium]